jgi:hypothetical protein
MPKLGLSYENPVTAVFLRTLAWELYVAEKKVRVRDAETQLQAARKELGLAPLKGGAVRDFIQKLRLPPKPLLSGKNEPPFPMEAKWKKEWRLLYLPPHSLVRQLSDRPVCKSISPIVGEQSHTQLLLTLRDPTVPTLRVFAGTSQPGSGTFNQLRGLYFLRLNNGLYVGKTDEFDVRLPQHFKNKHPVWWVFVALEEDPYMFTLDALAAAEALLISFWNETSLLSNSQRGSDQRPAFAYLQQAILLVEAASATLIWLSRECQGLGLPQLDIPFKLWSGRGWPGCYEKVPGA